MYSTIVLLKTSGVSQGFSDLQSTEDAAAAGDCIVVYPGTYNLGTGRLILKNGVNKKFMPGVTITSSHGTATVGDNNAACVQAWDGEPTIQNSGAGATLLLQHASSSIDLNSGGTLILSGSIEADISVAAGTKYLILGTNSYTAAQGVSTRYIKLPAGKWRVLGLTVSTKYLGGTGTGTVVTTVLKDGVATTVIATNTYTSVSTPSFADSDPANSADFIGGANGNSMLIKVVSTTTNSSTHSDYQFQIKLKKIQ